MRSKFSESYHHIVTNLPWKFRAIYPRLSCPLLCRIFAFRSGPLASHSWLYVFMRWHRTGAGWRSSHPCPIATTWTNCGRRGSGKNQSRWNRRRIKRHQQNMFRLSPWSGQTSRLQSVSLSFPPCFGVYFFWPKRYLSDLSRLLLKRLSKRKITV